MTEKHINFLLSQIKNKKYSVPARFENVEISYLAGIYNGIGAEWMPQVIRKLIACFLPFLEPESLIHDYEFSGTNKSYFAFTKANLRLAYNSFKGGHLFIGCAAAFICQLFGWSAWKDGKETMAYYYYLKGK